MEQLDKIRDASDVLNALVKDYPASPEAFTAREKLKAFLSDGK
jgi:TolA-binding protein